MSLLTIVQSVCTTVKIPRPSSAINSNDSNIQFLVEAARDEIAVLTVRYGWKVLEEEYLITLVAGQDKYPVPADFRRWIPLTQWNRAENRRLVGPLTPQQWQQRKSGLVDLTINTEFRLTGLDEEGIVVHPVPDTGTAGTVLALEYVSGEAVLPQRWIEGRPYNLGDYCYYKGNIYRALSSATSGHIPPVHTSGEMFDDGVNWLYTNEAYTLRHDHDRFKLDEYLIKLGLKYRWYKENGHTFEPALQEYKSYFNDIAGANEGAGRLSLGVTCRGNRSMWHEPPSADSGYGVES